MKKVVFTYTPSTPGVLCFRRNVDGYFYDFSDDTYKTEGSVTTKFVIPTEYITAPGVYYVENDISWDDGIYQAIWYPDDTETGTPVAWGMELSGNEQVLPNVTINEAAIATEVWTGAEGLVAYNNIVDGSAAAQATQTIIDELVEETPGTGVSRFTAEALAEAPAPDSADILADIATMQGDVTSILADTNELQGDWANDGRLDSILDTVAADAATAAGYGAGDASQTTLLQVKAKTDLIVSPGSVSGWTNPNSVLPPGGPTLVSDLFTNVREMLHDREANLYDNTLLLPLYNRAVSEINTLLVALQADVAINQGNITGDGTNYSFALPANFLAPVPQQFKPRSPETSTSNYGWGRALEHVDRMSPNMHAVPTTVAAPSKFYIVINATSQYVYFDTIPPSGYIYDMLYFTVPTSVTAATFNAAVVPWLGYLDNLVSRSVEEFAREGKEFTSEKRALWRARAEADIAMILGLRHLQSQERTPSMFRSMPRSNEVW